jgi:alpha/beta hydrolase family protein
MIRRCRFVLVLLSLLVLPANHSRGEVVALEILHREPYAGGKPFGDTGPYEKITGIVRYAVDPGHKRNRVIVDLGLAPQNAAGKVEFAADFVILAPRDPARGNGAIFYDVNNRGNKLALRFFNFAPGGNDLDKPGSEGDGFLFRRGYTVVWCGWIGELLPGDGRLLLRAPVVTDNGRPIHGIVRQELSTDKPADSLPLSRREGHGSYRPAPDGLAKSILTWRMRETDPRMEIPRNQWRLEFPPPLAVKEGVPGTLGQIRLRVAGGFRPGYLYELIYEAEGPIVQGLGFAAVRDLISFLRHEDGPKTPIRRGDGKPAFNRALGFGVSQSGRFLRTFLYLGFNADEKGRIVFDGVMPHVAGGGLGYFNHRFAQPNRFAGQHEDHTYPVDYFPFTYGPSHDPFSKRPDSILRRYASGRCMPRVMHTQSAAEYWHRSGSLVHTDPLGEKDVEIPDNVRIYAFGGTQHGPASDPPGRGIGDNLTNPGDYRPFLRGLLDALDRWVTHGSTPPPSRYPRIDQKTLVAWEQHVTRFPSLPGVRYPTVIQQPAALDFGPRFLKEGISTQEPPHSVGQYVVRVPASGPDGNDLGTLLPPEVGVPLATYTGWNLRRRDVGAEAMLANLAGSFIPFAKTKAERETTGDPRTSIDERYGDFATYLKQFEANCRQLVQEGYLLAQDADRLVKSRERYRKWFK